MFAADKIKRLNRLYAVSSGINEAIVRVADESRLYLEACRIAVERGGFMTAWIGREDPLLKVLVPVARWGKDEGYIDSIRITTDAVTRGGLGPGGMSFRSGKAAVCNDIEADTRFFAFRAEALTHGYRACAAFPLKQAGKPFAVFFVYASEPLYFDQEELALLTSLAENFSFAIEAREREAQRSVMEAALRSSEARLRAVVHNVPACVKLLAPDGEVLDINPAGLAIFKAPSALAVVGRNILEFVHVADRESYRKMHMNVMAGEPSQMQVRVVDLEGATLWMDTHAVPLRAEDGTVATVLCLTRDVTQERAFHDSQLESQAEILRLNAELEQRVRQRTSQLEMANRELQAFSYSIAHDLRAPLMAIGGFSQALEGVLAPGASEKVAHYLHRMREGVQRTSEMIDALLSLAHLSRAELRWEPVDLSALALRAHESCKAQTDAAVALRVTPGMTAQGDPRLLQLVMDNLVGNACKFSATGASPRVEVTAQPGPEGETIYEVRDNGVGFDMAYAANLFGAFQRLHRPAEFPGTGIGLANVRRIVSRHSGRVWAYSRPGEGAAFYFTLGKEPA